MPDPGKGDSVSDQDNQLQQAVCATIQTEIGALRSFVDRRIAELSAEVHATFDLMDFSETNLTGQLNGIRDQIANLVAMPAAATRNSGLELEAVVQQTEAAANRIMEAAEAIGDWLRDGTRDADSMQAINQKINAIFEACSFQDVTGQRIRRAIQHLQQVETMLTDLAPQQQGERSTADAQAQSPADDPAQPAMAPATTDPDLAQNAVDSLFD
jgi:chemotaxis protein CheZ